MITEIQPDIRLPKAKFYKVYTTLLTQLGGTGIPTNIDLQDNINGPIIWTRNGAGQYTGTLANKFIENKTTVSITGTNAGTTVTALRQTINTIEVNTVWSSDGSPADGLLNKAMLEIRIYE